jgi:NitT/TauT family transport system permease protein
LNVAVGMLILLAVWQLTVLFGGHNEALLPPPGKVFGSLIDLVLDGTLFIHLGISLYRFLCGYLSAVIIAVVLGLILGRMMKVWAVIDPIVQLLRPVAPIAWSPFIILWFNLGSASAIVIIFIAAFYPVLLSTVSAVKRVDPIYLRVAENFEIKQPQLMTKIILPAAFPYIANGLHIALGTAWIFLVSGEMIGAQSGLGYLIVDGRNLLRLDLVLVGIIVIGAMGMLLDKLIRLFERWVEIKWGHEA